MSLTERSAFDLRTLEVDHKIPQQNFFEALLRSDDLVIDITENRVDLAPTEVEPEIEPDVEPEVEPEVDDRSRDDRAAQTGMHLRRVRLRSVAKVGTLFFVVAYLTLVGSGVLLWNAAMRLGLVADLENLVTTSLGLDAFEVSGPQLFDLLTIGAAVVCGLGLFVTVLLAVVYNVAGSLFGGLAFETAPLRRRPGLLRRGLRRLRTATA